MPRGDLPFFFQLWLIFFLHRLIFYYPIVSFINLFIHIIRDATAPSAVSDLSLLEAVVGHFSRLEYASGGEVSITFAREATNIARSLVTSGKEGGVGGGGGQAVASRNLSGGQAVTTGSSLLDNVSFLPQYDQVRGLPSLFLSLLFSCCRTVLCLCWRG